MKKRGVASGPCRLGPVYRPGTSVLFVLKITRSRYWLLGANLLLLHSNHQLRPLRAVCAFKQQQQARRRYILYY